VVSSFALTVRYVVASLISQALVHQNFPSAGAPELTGAAVPSFLVHPRVVSEVEEGGSGALTGGAIGKNGRPDETCMRGNSCRRGGCELCGAADVNPAADNGGSTTLLATCDTV